jgi:hypothetical protein
MIMTALLIASSICFYADLRHTNNLKREYATYLVKHNEELTKILRTLS